MSFRKPDHDAPSFGNANFEQLMSRIRNSTTQHFAPLMAAPINESTIRTKTVMAMGKGQTARGPGIH